MKTYNFDVTLDEDVDGRWSSWLTSYPACTAWGHTKSEALQALADMTVVFLEVMSDDGEPVYADRVEPIDEHPTEQRNLVDLAGRVLSGSPSIKASVSNESIRIPVAA